MAGADECGNGGCCFHFALCLLVTMIEFKTFSDQSLRSYRQ